MYLRQYGIESQKTAAYTPEQNGVSERLNFTLQEKARSMLAESPFATGFWAEAVSTANYLRNRSPTSALDGRTPDEVWTGRVPYLGHIRVFGCTTWVHIQKERR